MYGYVTRSKQRWWRSFPANSSTQIYVCLQHSFF